MKPTHEDREVRALLDDAVAHVEPRPGLDAIRSRTTGSRGRRARAWGAAGGAVLVTAATVAGVVLLGGGPTAPSTGPAPAGQSTAPASGPVESVYFVGRTGGGSRLFSERHHTASEGTAIVEAVTDAVAGTSADLDYRTAWPASTRVLHAQLRDKVLSIDLSGTAARPSGLTRADAALALQQLVYTAQGAAGRQLPVTFLVHGRSTATLLGEPTDRPVPAASADDTLAPVSVTSPAEGSTVTSPFTVTGRASTFEANVQWELRRIGGRRLSRGFTTAAECCTLAPYSFRVSAPPGEYTLVVHDENVSRSEGSPRSQDTKRVTVH